jgi:hypothetical protein
MHPNYESNSEVVLSPVKIYIGVRPSRRCISGHCKIDIPNIERIYNPNAFTKWVSVPVAVRMDDCTCVSSFVDLILKNGMILGILHEVIRALGVIASRGF